MMTFAWVTVGVALLGFLVFIGYMIGWMRGGGETEEKLRIYDYRYGDDSKIHYLIEHRDKSRHWYAVDLGTEELDEED